MKLNNHLISTLNNALTIIELNVLQYLTELLVCFNILFFMSFGVAPRFTAVQLL